MLNEPDFSLLKGLSADDAKKAIGPLHLDHYQQGNKNLYYIGTHHGTHLENTTHEIIAQAISKHKPQLVVLEGIESARGLSPSLGFDKPGIKPHEARQRYWQSEENVHTAELLRRLHIPFIGGEPTPKDIFAALRQQGYSNQDAMGLYVVRTIPQWRRRGQVKDRAHLLTLVDNFLKSPLFSHVPPEERLTAEGFTSWYDAHKQSLGGKDYTQLIAADSNPNHSPSANDFQRMSNAMDMARDANILRTIEGGLKQYDKVMVVYGNAHQHVQAPVLEQMFSGKPLEEKLVLAPPVPPSLPAAPVAKPTAPTHNNRLVEQISRISLLVAGAGAAAVSALLLKSHQHTKHTFSLVAGIAGMAVGLGSAAMAMFGFRQQAAKPPCGADKPCQQQPSALPKASALSVPEAQQSQLPGHVARLATREAPSLSLQK
jgi:hypothetical protein